MIIFVCFFLNSLELAELEEGKTAEALVGDEWKNGTSETSREVQESLGVVGGE